MHSPKNGTFVERKFFVWHATIVIGSVIAIGLFHSDKDYVLVCASFWSSWFTLHSGVRRGIRRTLDCSGDFTLYVDCTAVNLTIRSQIMSIEFIYIMPLLVNDRVETTLI